MQKRERRQKRTGKMADKIFAIVFVVCLLLIMIVNLLVPTREMSVDENRRLAGRPRMTLDSVLSGDYMKKQEVYLRDQFVGRELLRDIQVIWSRVSGSREENGVLIGKEDQLMEKILTPDQEVLGANLEAIKQYAANHPDIPVSMMLVPDAASLLQDKVPYLYAPVDQKRMFAQVKRELEESVNWIDVESILQKHIEEPIYYKTDKHWTSAGAFYVFQGAAEKLGIGAATAGKFAIYPISVNFNGDLSARSGCEENVKEVIEMYTPVEGDTDVIVNYVDEQRKTTSLYNSSKLKSADQYDVFLGGDSSVIDIRTVSESKRRLLIMKDSFANSFIPFLAPYFREIVVVDPQYFSGTIEDIMDSYRITDALILYSGNTFFQDNNISGVLSREQ